MNRRTVALAGTFAVSVAAMVFAVLALTAAAPQGPLTFMAFAAPAGIAVVMLSVVTALGRNRSGDDRRQPQE